MRTYLRLLPITAVLLVALIAGSALLMNSVLASPNNQVDCEDGTVNVDSRILAAWPNTDFCQHEYPIGEFFPGGPPRDGIPPVYPDDYVYPDHIVTLGGREPTFAVDYQRVDDAAEWLVDQTPVLAVEVDGDARAYPLAVLTRHEIANTTIGDIPVAVTFCPLCNAGVVFDRRLNGEELMFGVSGLLRNSDLVMWDHTTESWWQQATGQGVVGAMAGEQLNFLTSSMVSFGDFMAQYPDGLVFVPSRGGELQIGYDYNPYAGYDTDDSPFLYFDSVDPRLDAVERVLGYSNGEDAIAYPFELLSEEIVINDEIDGEPVAIFWQPGAVSALDQSRISTSREVGAGNIFDPRLPDGTVLSFYADGTTIKDEQTDSVWNIFGVAIEGELEGTRLLQLRSVTHFWFAWSAFEPQTGVYGK